MLASLVSAWPSTILFVKKGCECLLRHGGEMCKTRAHSLDTWPDDSSVLVQNCPKTLDFSHLPFRRHAQACHHCSLKCYKCVVCHWLPSFQVSSYSSIILLLSRRVT